LPNRFVGRGDPGAGPASHAGVWSKPGRHRQGDGGAQALAGHRDLAGRNVEVNLEAAQIGGKTHPGKSGNHSGNIELNKDWKLFFRI
jgi:hypothetical protein